MSLPKIHLIHTGGTLGMKATPIKDRQKAFQEKIDSLKFLHSVANFTCDVMCDIDSSDMNPKLWKELAKRVDKVIKEDEDLQSVVIIHGTDTMAWTASALSFMFSGLPCPIVLTGSQRPLEIYRSDARRNLLNAVEATLKVPNEVMIVFGDKVIRGCSVTKDSIFHFDAFRSYNTPLIGHIGLDIIIPKGMKSRKKPYWFDGRLDNNIALWPLIPGEDGRVGMSLLDMGVKGLILEAFGAGNVPVVSSAILDVLQEAQNRKVPVVLSTQCRHGLVQPDLYEGGREALKRGVIFAPGMSREAIQLKMMVMLGRKVNYRKFPKEFSRNWNGEIIEDGKDQVAYFRGMK